MCVSRHVKPATASFQTAAHETAADFSFKCLVFKRMSNFPPSAHKPFLHLSSFFFFVSVYGTFCIHTVRKLIMGYKTIRKWDNSTL